jgi:hypothetical protein
MSESLYKAVKENNTERTRLLLQLGANVYPLAGIAIADKNIELLEELANIANNQGYWIDVFGMAVAGYHYEMADFFFEKGVSQRDLNRELEFVLERNDFKAARYLLEKGANLNAIDPWVADKLLEDV